MKRIKELFTRLKRGPTEVIGLEVGPARVCGVRMRKGTNEVAVLAADVMRRSPAAQTASEGHPSLSAIEIPQRLRARYVCLATPAESAVIRLLTFPGRAESGMDARIMESMGIESPENYRMSYKVLSEGHGRTDTRALAVAVPEQEAAAVTAMFATGLPAPFSLEVSCLATMTAFLHGPGKKHQDGAVGVFDFAPTSCLLAFFQNDSLALIRRFDKGTNSILDKVRETLGVDTETAEGILSDGSFDISNTIAEVMEPLIKQLIISRDFVERRENCKIGKLYVSGGLAVSRNVQEQIRTTLDIEVATWSPFEAFAVAPSAVPDEWTGREWLFTAAVGACLGTFEET